MNDDQIKDIETMARALFYETATAYQLRRDNVPVFTVPKDKHAYRNLLVYASRYQFYLKLHDEIDFLITR